MSRRYGAHIPALCEIVEVIGPCSTGEVYAFSTAMTRPNVEKYCTRAVGLGLMTVDRSGRLKQWSVVPGWRDLIDVHNTKTCKPVQQRPAKAHHLHACWGAA
ncbi:MAG: hypothetical protein JJD98_02735 [Polaromonas sp.]|nr:hypothetical protein [Polaromonas sp.]